MKLLILMLTVILCCFSCGNEETTEEIVKPWIEHESFRMEQKYIINSEITSNSLMLKTTDTITTIDKTDDVTFYAAVTKNLITAAFSEKYFAAYEHNSLRIGSSVRPVSFVSLIDFETIEESFDESDIQDLGKIGVMSGNQLLLPLKNLYLLTFEDEYPDYPDYPGDPQLISTIKTEYNDFITEMKAFDDFYLISSRNKTYKMDKSGNIQLILNERSFDFFKFNGKYFAFAGTTQASFDMRLYSSENGTDWKLFLTNWRTFDQIPFDFICKFFVVNNKLYYFRFDKIAYIDFENLAYREVDTSNIETNYITSVAEFNNKVYVSTKSGLFYKELEDFHVLKKEKTE